MGSNNQESKLSRKLNWLHGVVSMVGLMIGAGIFVIAGQAAGTVGPLVPVVFLLIIPVIIATAIIYSIYMSGPLGEHAGGAYVHISRTWNSLYLGYIVMWLKWVAYAGSIAAIGLELGSAMNSLSGLEFLSPTIWALIAITALFLIQILGADAFGNSQTLMTAPLVIALLLLAIPGLLFLQGENFTPILPQELYSNGFITPVLAGGSAILFSFIGFEALAQTGEEMSGARQYTKLFTYTSLGVGMLYTLVTLVVIGTIGWESAASATTPLTAAAQTYFPAGTGIIITFASILAFLTTINSCYYVPSRLLYSFSKDNIIPNIFSHVNDRFRTPDISLAITYLLSVLFIVTATASFGVTITVTAVTIVYGLHSFSGAVLPWIRPDLYDRCQFKLSPAKCTIIGGASAIVMVLFGWQTLALGGIEPAITMMLQGNIVEGLTSNSTLVLLVWGIIGTGIYYGYQLYRQAQGNEIEKKQVLQRLYQEPMSKSDD